VHHRNKDLCAYAKTTSPLLHAKFTLLLSATADARCKGRDQHPSVYLPNPRGAGPAWHPSIYLSVHPHIPRYGFAASLQIDSARRTSALHTHRTSLISSKSTVNVSAVAFAMQPTMSSQEPPRPGVHKRNEDPFMSAKYGRNVLFCMPNRTKDILLVSVMMGTTKHVLSTDTRGLATQSTASCVRIGTKYPILNAK
jgi:hypothetical protein